MSRREPARTRSTELARQNWAKSEQRLTQVCPKVWRHPCCRLVASPRTCPSHRFAYIATIINFFPHAFTRLPKFLSFSPCYDIRERILAFFFLRSVKKLPKGVTNGRHFGSRRGGNTRRKSFHRWLRFRQIQCDFFLHSLWCARRFHSFSNRLIVACRTNARVVNLPTTAILVLEKNDIDGIICDEFHKVRRNFFRNDWQELFLNRLIKEYLRRICHEEKTLFTNHSKNDRE